MNPTVYLGGIACETGQAVDIEAAQMAPQTRALLQSEANGVRCFSHHPGQHWELVTRAVTRALADSGRQPDDIDAVLLVSGLLDAQNNLEALWLAELGRTLQMQAVPFYAVGLAGCAGFHAGLKLAAALTASGEAEHVLLVTFDQAGDALQRVYGEGSDFVYVTGDAAAACVVSRQPAQMQYALRGKVQYSSNTEQIEHFSNDTDMRSIAALVKRTCQHAEIAPRAVHHFICNNYTLEATRLFCQLAGISFSKAVTAPLAQHAHCFSADNLINLGHLHAEGALQPGEHALLFSTGPFQLGACLITRLAC